MIDVFVLCAILLVTMAGMIFRGMKPIYVAGFLFAAFALSGLGDGPIGHQPVVPVKAYIVIAITAVAVGLMAYFGRHRIIASQED